MLPEMSAQPKYVEDQPTTAIPAVLAELNQRHEKPRAHQIKVRQELLTLSTKLA
jgi:hypothetical protein